MKSLLHFDHHLVDNLPMSNKYHHHATSNLNEQIEGQISGTRRNIPLDTNRRIIMETINRYLKETVCNIVTGIGKEITQ